MSSKTIVFGLSLTLASVFAFLLGLHSARGQREKPSTRMAAAAKSPLGHARSHERERVAPVRKPSLTPAQVSERARRALLGSGSPEDANLLASRAFIELLDQLDPPGFRQLAQTFELIYPLDYERQRAWLFEAWGKKDGAGAFAYGLADFKRRSRYSVLGNVLAGWAEENPRAALAAFEAIDAGVLAPLERAQLRTDLYRGWASRDPQGVVSDSWALSKDYDKDGHRENVQGWAATFAAAEMARRDPGSAQAWVESLPDGPGKTAARCSLPIMLLANDPARGDRLFQEFAEAGYSDALYRTFARAHFDSGLQNAVQWAAGFPSAATRANAVAALTAEWAATDVRAAGEWVNQMPKTTGEWDKTLSAYSVAAAEHSPAAALDWAMTVQNSDLQLVTLKKISAVWHKKDPRAAEKWMRTLGLFDVNDLEDYLR